MITYRALEEFLSHIEYGLEHIKSMEFDQKAIIELLHIARNYDASKLVHSYFDCCKKHLTTENVLDFLNEAMSSNATEEVIHFAMFVTRDYDTFKSLLISPPSRERLFLNTISKTLFEGV